MKKILLIEDNDDTRENAAEILELANYTVIVAANGIDGVEKALLHHPDLIVCDIMMPGLDGYGVLHAIHKNETIKNTPFIFLTAKVKRAEFRKGMELGADDYITKPFDGIELLNAVECRLKKIRLLEEEITSGLAGFQNLVQIYAQKNTLSDFTEGRNVNVYQKNQIIYWEGNHPTMIYYVLKGRAKTFKTSGCGKEFITEINGAGDFLGYVSLIEGTPFKDSAAALEKTEIALIPKEDFEELLNKNADMNTRFIKLLAKNIAAKEEHLLKLAYYTSRKKVADSLIFLERAYKTENNDSPVISISRENLASLAGTATESVVRILGDFRDEKLIEITNRNIKIIDMEKLKHLVN